MNPQSPQFRKWLRESDIFAWVNSALRLDGYAPDRETAAQLARGEMVASAPLSAYALAARWREVYADIQSCVQMQARLEGRLLGRWANIICGQDGSKSAVELFRRGNNVVYEWDLIPISSKSINDKLTDLLKEYRLSCMTRGESADLLITLFMELNRLYAFGGSTLQISLTVLCFGLMSMGYPLPEISLSDREFNTIMADYIHKPDIRPFKKILQNCIYNRLDTVLIYAKEFEENENGN